jgi:predicted transcriptional regulator
MDELELIESYKNGEGIDILCTQYKIGKLKLKTILKNNGVDIRKRGNTQKYKFEYSELNFNNENIVATCKETGKQFKDYKNQSGSLTNHLKSLGHPVLKSYEGISFYRKNGFHWYTPFFNFDEIDKSTQIECQICHKSFKSNKGGSLSTHLIKVHQMTAKEYLAGFPNESKYFNIEPDLENIKCLICGQEMRIITNTHMLNSHGLTVFDYKKKFPFAKIVANDIHLKYKKNISTFNETAEKSFTSSGEKEIQLFLTELGFNVLTKNRKRFKGMEIDLLIEEHNLAIEYNGVRYHTENFGKKDSDYHLNKTQRAAEQGVKLIHIFEDEWILSKELVKTKLMHLLNINTGEKIYARKCVVKKIKKNISNSFLEKNHIQGKVRSTYEYGLYFNDSLVSVMTFTLKKENVYELSRFASDSKFIVIGGAGKLLKHFTSIHKPNSIISFADRRWTIDPNDNMYIKLGFEHVTTLKPDYRYFKSSYHRLKRHHKFGFRKQILLRKYPTILNSNMTEKEMTTLLGFDRIWDCGLFKFQFKY